MKLCYRRFESGDPVIILHGVFGISDNWVTIGKRLAEKLVIIDISTRGYVPRQMHIEIIHAMQSVDFDKITKRSEVETELAPIKSSRLRQFILKNLYRVNDRRFGWRINMEAIFENIDLISEGIETDKTYDHPTLFIKGGASDYIQEGDLDIILNIFPQATVKTIDGATHWLHADKPDDLCLLLSDFLQKDCAY